MGISERELPLVLDQIDELLHELHAELMFASSARRSEWRHIERFVGSAAAECGRPRYPCLCRSE